MKLRTLLIPAVVLAVPLAALAGDGAAQITLAASPLAPAMWSAGNVVRITALVGLSPYPTGSVRCLISCAA